MVLVVEGVIAAVYARDVGLYDIAAVLEREHIALFFARGRIFVETCLAPFQLAVLILFIGFLQQALGGPCAYLCSRQHPRAL